LLMKLRPPWRRCLAWPILFGLVLFSSVLTSATLEDDSRGLLPPYSADRSPMVAQIRQGFRSRDLSLMQTKIEELVRQEPVNFEGYFWGGFLAIQRRNNHDAVRFLRR